MTSEQNELPFERALGVIWKPGNDVLGFKINVQNQPITKRGILSSIFSLYDPFGIAIPVTILGRCIFQEACNKKLSWDENLPEELKTKWIGWWNDVPLLNSYEIERCYLGQLTNFENGQLHIFADGSEKAFAAVAYLRFENKNKVHCAFVAAKARLVPLNNNALKTIPRIELNAAKLAVNLMQTLTKNLDFKINATFMWSDSITVINYICSENSRFQRFVSNRVSYIRNLTTPDQWRHVPGNLNPADVASRGCNASAFVFDKDWKMGPDFLWKSCDQWPKNPNNFEISPENLELKRSDYTKINMVISIKESTIDKILNYFSCWIKVKQTVGYFLRLKNGLKSQNWRSGFLSIIELRRSESAIWTYIQHQYFERQITLLKNNQELNKNDPLIKLHPIIGKDELLRVGGRQNKSQASYNVKHPIILPPDPHTVTLLVREYHKNMGHLGRETVLSAIRTKYWILKGNSLVRRIVRECLICRRNQAQASEQLVSNLPEERFIINIPAFTNVGIDCFGPLIIQRARGTDKRYGIVFTCLSSRAIHLEVLTSLSTDSFICALRRFAARRGNVKSVRCDNGTNFVGASRELRTAIKEWNKTHVEKWCQQRNIEWKFNTPLASHQGGIWEREIRTVKKVLASVLNEQPIKLTDEALSTLICEVENILNNRPLTAISDDPNDLEPLTPNHCC